MAIISMLSLTMLLDFGYQTLRGKLNIPFQILRSLTKRYVIILCLKPILFKKFDHISNIDSIKLEYQ